MIRSLAFALALAAMATGAVAADNTLTRAEKKAGWILLFDGKTTDGWRGFKQAGTDLGWKAGNGLLSPDPTAAKDLVTRAEFADFEFRFEWRISPGGNSGVMFHVTDAGKRTYESGPEYQILDNARGEPPLEQAGGLFALYSPSRDVTKPVGQFNRARLVVDQGQVQHWLNGVLVARYDMGSADFKARVAASKFKAWLPFAASPSGAIALQNHGDAVTFRNLKIRPIR